MSLDLVVLTRGNAGSFDQAVAVYSEEASGRPDESGDLEKYARDVYNAYDDDNWPFAVAPEAWESEAPRLVERAHGRNLIVLDPQWGDEGKLFPPGEPYA